ncbi:MAG TPA: hypothetical protein VKS82_14345 [Streptosporangiaceae bacterium]|nr:hypothetical protein [Streptosporangiaceae bacterium]
MTDRDLLKQMKESADAAAKELGFTSLGEALNWLRENGEDE